MKVFVIIFVSSIDLIDKVLGVVNNLECIDSYFEEIVLKYEEFIGRRYFF